MNAEAKTKESLSRDQLNSLIIDSIQDIKGKNILKLDLRGLDDAPTDFFIVCEGDSNTQVKAISDRIYQRVKKEGGTLPNHIEGERQALWVCVDYFTTVVHIFHKEKRDFYNLEDLWGDAKFTNYENL